MSTALYCRKHKSAERLTGREVEDLINGLAMYPPKSSSASWCPTAQVKRYRSTEVEKEYLNVLRGLRIVAVKRGLEEYRRVGGGEAPRYALPNPRGDGIRRAADLIRAGAPVGQIAAVVRDAMAAHVKPLLDKMQPASQVTVSRTLSVFPEAVEAAGLVVELPPAPVWVPPPAHLDEDLINREAGLPARERRHRGIPTQVGFSQQCSVCEWSPTGTAHVRTEREAAQAIRRAHNPMGRDD